MSNTDLYAGREQTLVKHLILKGYLERFAHIVGTSWDAITYVDCFSGPWNVKSEDFSDSSFSIALNELRKARATHQAKGHTLKLRCFFLEKNRAAYGRLKEFADRLKDVEVETRHASLEDAIPAIIQFVVQGGPRSFPFLFIDPKGWTGFDMDVITPLLKLHPAEVLITLMTGDIRRFINSPQERTQESFRKLFGSIASRARIQKLPTKEWVDAVVSEYSQEVIRTGQFKYTTAAIVLYPEFNRVRFNLIYATRHARGIEVFKDAEKKAMAEMEIARSDAKRRRRQSKSRQAELFGAEVLHDAGYYDSLRERYLAKAKAGVLQLLLSMPRVPYDRVWSIALSFPLTWASDLKYWIASWVKEGHLDIDGMIPGQRVPKVGKNNILVWKANRPEKNANR